MMESSLVEKLTHEYKKAVQQEWALLYANDAELQLKDSFVTFQKESKSSDIDHEKPFTLSNILSEHGHFVFLGEPGSGKSTTLQFIGLCFAYDNWYETKLNAKKEYVPIKISLQQFASILSEPGPTMERALGLTLREYLRDLGEQQAYKLIRVWLHEGKLLLLLDGLDEVPDKNREGVREEIYRFSSSLQTTESRVIVSSRLAGYSTFSSSLFKEFKLKPFSDIEETSVYLMSWMMAFRQDWNSEKAGAETSYLIKQMKLHLALRNVIDNPLVLRISAQVFTSGGEIAKNRSILYQLFINDLWDRAVHRGADSNLEDEVLSNCETLAWQLRTKNEPDIQNDILKVISEKMELVVKIGDNITFSHTTLQEYFVGRRLVRAWQKNRGLTWAFLRPRLHMSEWREPILLMGGSLDKSDASYLSRKICCAHSLGERRLHRDKILIGTLAGEDMFVNQRVRDKILRIVRLINNKWGKRIMGKQGWQELRDLVKAIGNFGKPAIPTLIEFLKNEDDDLVFIATLRTLERLNAVEAGPVIFELYNNTGYYFTKANLLFALGTLKVKKAIPEMLEAIESGDDYCGSIGADALGNMKAIELIPTLIQFLSHEKWGVQEAAAEALGRMGRASIPAIRQVLKHDDSQVRLAAVRALRETHLKEAIPDLHFALKDQDDDVRYEAISALEEINPTDENLDWIYARRKEIADAKAVISPTYTIPEAFNVIKKNFPGSVYEPNALKALEDEFDDSINFLRQELKSSEVEARWVAAIVLGRLSATEAIPDLCISLKDENAYVKREIIKAVEILHAKEAIPYLLDILATNTEKDIRRRVITALGNLHAVEAIADLKHALEDTELQIPAAIALGKIKILDAMPYLRNNYSIKNQSESKVLRDMLRDFVSSTPVFKNDEERSSYMRELNRIRKEGIEERLAIERLEELAVSNSPIRDPLEQRQPAKILKFIQTVLIFIFVIIIFAILAVLNTIYGSAEDIIKDIISQPIRMWIITHPILTILIFLGFGIIIGLLIWLAEWLRSSIRKNGSNS